MHRFLIAALIAAASACHRSTPAVAPPAASATPPFDAVVKRDEPLLGNLNTATSYYSHMTYVNEETRTRRVDCSGFVDYAVRRVLPEAYDKIPHPSTARPLANDWYNYLRERFQSASTQESVRWREIRHVGELRAERRAPALVAGPSV